MRTIVALLFVSAVLSASCTGSVHDFFEGFVAGLNDTYLSQDIIALHDAGDLVNAGVKDVVDAAKTHDVDAIASAAEELINDIHQFAVVSHNTLLDIENILNKFAAATQNFSSNVIISHLYANYPRIMTDVTNATSLNPYAVGYSVADLLKVIALGNATIDASSARQLRKLEEEFGPIQNGITKALNGILFIKGFLEVANTTINVTNFQYFVDNTTKSAIIVDKIMADVKKGDYPGAFTDAYSFYSNLWVVLADTTTLRVQVADWINRDLPLFSNSQKIMGAVTGLVMNYAKTQANINMIQTGYANGTYEIVGNGVGGIYNEVLTGLQM